MTRPISDEEYREDLASYAVGLDVERFYCSWRLLLILWGSVWFCSNVSWRRYYTTIWDRFGRWIASSARRSRDLAGFLAVFSREAKLASIGANADERQCLVALVALPYPQQRQMIRQLRDDTTLLVALVKEFQRRYGKGKTEEETIENQEENDVELS